MLTRRSGWRAHDDPSRSPVSVMYPAPMSAVFVDNLIWNTGLLGVPNSERNFLRAIHSPASLSALISYLSSRQPGRAMFLTSTWVDKHPQAYPLNGAKNCEIGDLLVLWRWLDVSGKVMRRVGWILQAKMAETPTRMSHRDSSSLREYALYEDRANWHFELKHGVQNLGSFDLTRDAHLDPATVLPASAQHWSYLQIRNPKATPVWATPLQTRWDSTGVGYWLEGFADGISSMMESSPGKGAVLDTVNPQWTALCDALETFAADRNSRLAGGSWQRSCVALAADSDIGVESIYRLLDEEVLDSSKEDVALFRNRYWLESNKVIRGVPGRSDSAEADFDRSGGFSVVRVDSIAPTERQDP